MEALNKSDEHCMKWYSNRGRLWFCTGACIQMAPRSPAWRNPSCSGKGNRTLMASLSSSLSSDNILCPDALCQSTSPLHFWKQNNLLLRWVFGIWIRYQLERKHPTLQYLDLTLNYSFPLRPNPGGMLCNDSSSNWVPATHVGDLDRPWLLASFINHPTHPAAAVIWGANK